MSIIIDELHRHPIRVQHYFRLPSQKPDKYDESNSPEAEFKSLTEIANPNSIRNTQAEQTLDLAFLMSNLILDLSQLEIISLTSIHLKVHHLGLWCLLIHIRLEWW